MTNNKFAGEQDNTVYLSLVIGQFEVEAGLDSWDSTAGPFGVQRQVAALHIGLATNCTRMTVFRTDDTTHSILQRS